jgi:hypothetical protein
MGEFIRIAFSREVVGLIVSNIIFSISVTQVTQNRRQN